MQVISLGQARGAHISDGLPGSHIVSGTDDVINHVHVYGAIAIAVVDLDIVAGATILIGGDADYAASGGIDRRICITGHVNAIVHPPDI